MVSNTKSVNMTYSRIYKEVSNDTQHTDLSIHTTKICERSNLVVQEEIFNVNDNFDLDISIPRILRSHKSRNEISTENLKLRNNHKEINENIQKSIQNKLINHVRENSGVLPLISENKFIKSKSGTNSSVTLSKKHDTEM